MRPVWHGSPNKGSAGGGPAWAPLVTGMAPGPIQRPVVGVAPPGPGALIRPSPWRSVARPTAELRAAHAPPWRRPTRTASQTGGSRANTKPMAGCQRKRRLPSPGAGERRTISRDCRIGMTACHHHLQWRFARPPHISPGGRSVSARATNHPLNPRTADRLTQFPCVVPAGATTGCRLEWALNWA